MHFHVPTQFLNWSPGQPAAEVFDDSSHSAVVAAFHECDRDTNYYYCANPRLLFITMGGQSDSSVLGTRVSQGEIPISVPALYSVFQYLRAADAKNKPLEQNK